MILNSQTSVSSVMGPFEFGSSRTSGEMGVCSSVYIKFISSSLRAHKVGRWSLRIY